VAITATVLTEGSSTTDELEFVTASISPGNDKLILVLVAHGDTSGANNQPDSVFDGDFNDLDPVVSQQQGTGNQRISIWRGMSSSFPSGSFTIVFGSVTENCAWLVVEFDGVDTSGSNGSGAIVQSKGGVDSGTTQDLTLNSAVGAGNATFGGVIGNTQTPVYAAGAGFALLGTGWSMASPSNKGHAVWDVDGLQTISLTNSGTPTTAMVGVEIKTGSVVVVHSGAAAAAGTGAATATSVRTTFGAAAAAGIGAATAAVVRTTFAAAAASGTGAATATSVRTTFGAALAAGTGTLTAAWGVAVHSGAAAVAGAGALVAAPVRTAFGAAVAAGSGALTAAARQTHLAAAAASGTGALVAAAVRTAHATATASGTGALTAAPVRTTFGAALLAGAAVLVGAAGVLINAAASLSGAGVLIARPFFLWTPTGPESETWTPTATSSGGWTATTDFTETWTPTPGGPGD
jgi:hypothetical protein